MRNKPLRSPKEQKEGIEAAIKDDALPAQVLDVHVMPDYSSWLKDCKRPVQRYTKQHWTQLQWHFTKTEVVKDHYPLGVRTQYKKYANDTVFEIFDKKNVPLQTNVITETPYIPVRVEAPLSKGTHILTKFPEGPVPAMRFPLVEKKKLGGAQHRQKRRLDGNAVETTTLHYSGPYAAYCSTLERVKTYFKDQKEVVKQWIDFGAVFPDTDNAKVFAEERGMHTPLHDYLIGAREEEVYRRRGWIRASSTAVVGSETALAAATANMQINGASLFEEETMLTAVAQESVVVGTRPRDGRDGRQPLRLQPHALLEGSDFIEAAPQREGRVATTRASSQGGQEEDLSALSNKELVAMVKSLNGKGYSGKNKAELIAIVTRLRLAAAAPAGVANGVLVAPALAQEQLLQGDMAAPGAEEDIHGHEGGDDTDYAVPAAELEEDSDNDESNDAAAYQDSECEDFDDESLDGVDDDDEGEEEYDHVGDICDKRQRV